MKRLLSTVAVLAFAPAVALAALPTGTTAPDFTTQAALDGKDFTYKLSDALKKGPVVVYFYPKAFTSGCSLEAHQFAEAVDQFKAMGATVIGVSRDDLPTLEKFSTQVCQSKFPVASDKDGTIVKAYQVPYGVLPISNRTSFVVGKDGKIAYVYTDMAADKHVSNTLAAVKALAGGKS